MIVFDVPECQLWEELNSMLLDLASESTTQEGRERAVMNALTDEFSDPYKPYKQIVDLADQRRRIPPRASRQWV
jgi:hypothetical protein